MSLSKGSGLRGWRGWPWQGRRTTRLLSARPKMGGLQTLPRLGSICRLSVDEALADSRDVTCLWWGPVHLPPLAEKGIEPADWDESSRKCGTRQEPPSVAQSVRAAHVGADAPAVVGNRTGRVGLDWVGSSLVGLGWVGSGWVGLGRVWLAWVGLVGWDDASGVGWGDASGAGWGGDVR